MLFIFLSKHCVYSVNIFIIVNTDEVKIGMTIIHDSVPLYWHTKDKKPDGLEKSLEARFY